MSSKAPKDSQHSKKILKILGEKPALPVEFLTKNPLSSGTPPSQGEKKSSYALARSLKNLVGGGFVEIHDSVNQSYAKITNKGKLKLNSIKLEAEDALVSNTWDGFWRIIILDIGEDRKNERESLRYLLKKANFVCVKNTVWISPLPYEHLFTNIKKDLGLSTELMIIVTDKLDNETSLAFLKAMKEN